MKKKSDRITSPSSYPRTPVDEMFKNIRGQLGATYETMAAWSGMGTTTLHKWSEGASVEQVEALVRLLARVPGGVRHDILEKACPIMPSLDHPYICRDRLLASYLRGIVRNERGVTLVLGESEYLRTFVATALAQSLAAQNPNRVVVSGYDIHDVNWLVPIDGVEYLNAWKRPNGLEAKLSNRALKPAKMVFLNGIYSKVSAFRTQAQKISDLAHVVIADRSLPTQDLVNFAAPKHLVSVAVDASADSFDDAARMVISVREISGEDSKKAWPK